MLRGLRSCSVDADSISRAAGATCELPIWKVHSVALQFFWLFFLLSVCLCFFLAEQVCCSTIKRDRLICVIAAESATAEAAHTATVRATTAQLQLERRLQVQRADWLTDCWLDNCGVLLPLLFCAKQLEQAAKAEAETETEACSAFHTAWPGRVAAPSPSPVSCSVLAALSLKAANLSGWQLAQSQNSVGRCRHDAFDDWWLLKREQNYD